MIDAVSDVVYPWCFVFNGRVAVSGAHPAEALRQAAATPAQ
jgi:predicted DsbA family dithiol-disulfide isomerase